MNDHETTSTDAGSVDFPLTRDTRIGIYEDDGGMFEKVYVIRHVQENIGRVRYEFLGTIDDATAGEMGLAEFERVLEEAARGAGFAVWEA